MADHSSDLAIAALVLSLLVHVGIMYYMRPQVMAQVTPQAQQRMRTRGPMNMREPPPTPDSVKIDVIRDVDALKDSPAARADGPAPTVEGFDPSETLASAAAPEFALSGLAVPIPAAEDAPPLSERFSAQRGADVAATAVAPVSMSAASLASLASMRIDEDDAAPIKEDKGDSVRDERPVVDLVPEFTLPEPAVAALDQPPPGNTVAFDLPTELSPEKEFRPEVEVMGMVDERVVEAEKAAVRDLLDVRGAAELSSAVEVQARSAEAGQWVYFRVSLSPGADLPVISKDVVVLLDASGSIGRDRLASCREAARRILRSCTNTGDRFNLVAFRDKFSYAFKAWQECSRDSFKRADEWLDKLAAHGRTDVFATIRSVLTLPRDPERPLVAVVVTDGDANAGVSETAQILSRFTALNDGLVSVYMYGVKGSANRELLDVLTHGNRGESFIYDGDRVHAGNGLEALAERFRDPVLSDLRVVFAADSRAEVYPRRLRNLYKGEEVTLVGRAPKGTKEVSFSVKGLNGASPYEGFFTVRLTGAAMFDQNIPAEWSGEHAIDEKLK